VKQEVPDVISLLSDSDEELQEQEQVQEEGCTQDVSAATTLQLQLGQWPVGGVWRGVKALFETLPSHGLAELLEANPAWSDVILTAAVAACAAVSTAASTAAGGSASQQQQGPAALPAAAEGLLHLLGVLEVLLQQPGELVWCPAGPVPAPGQPGALQQVAAGTASILPAAAGVSSPQLAAALIRGCWGLVRQRQRGLVQAAVGCCKQLLLARSCHWRAAGVLGEELLPLAGLLLVQLPGSAAVDPLIRGVALEVRWGETATCLGGGRVTASPLCALLGRVAACQLSPSPSMPP
jgi:hypothetical protein